MEILDLSFGIFIFYQSIKFYSLNNECSKIQNTSQPQTFLHFTAHKKKQLKVSAHAHTLL